MKTVVSIALLAATYLLIAPAARAECTGQTPAFLIDSDGDGIPDACDPCPAGVANQPAVGGSRDPYCYLSAGFVPPDYQAAEALRAGPWWASGECVPAMAFPVTDTQPSPGAPARGLVVVGTNPASAGQVLAAAKAGRSWPADVPAVCMVSIDYSRTEMPISPLGLRAPVLATLYAAWQPSVQDDRYVPTDGLGLITGWPIESVSTRLFFRTVAPQQLERLEFSRAVVYGNDLFAVSSPTCLSSSVPSNLAPWYDPTTDVANSTPVPTCAGMGAESVAPEPTDWRVIPRALDRAFRAHRDVIRRVFAAAPLQDPAMEDAIEGIPLGLRSDDRDQFQDMQLLQTGAQVHPQSTGEWIVVPEAIAVLRQHLKYDRSGEEYVVGAYPPSSEATYLLNNASPPSAVVMQSFAIDQEIEDQIVDNAVRAVETTWPAWPAPAATSEHGLLYGNRWTSNGGPRDCWTSTVDDSDAAGFRPNQQLSYPISAPQENTLATAFCPSALAAWRRQPSAPTSQLVANEKCAPATKFQDDLKNAFLGDVVNQAATSTWDSVENLFGCCFNSACRFLGIDCDEGEDSPCCSREYHSFWSSIPNDALPKIAEAYFEKLKGFTPEMEWPLAGDNPSVPMVALLRGVDSGPTIHSHISNEDMFVGGHHQGMDWNWKVTSGDVAAIDPAYRMLAVRDGTFQGIENELELQVAMGQWSEGWASRGTLTGAYNLHGEKDLLTYLAGLVGDRGISPLGEIWAMDWPFNWLYGLEQNDAEWPSEVEGASFLLGYWRHHYGRGMFGSVSLQNTSRTSTAHLMAIDKSWPLGQPTDPGAQGVTPLDLEDWGSGPHRLSFLGEAILDCGHPPFKVEIHPPHVLTMDLAHRAYGDASIGVVAAAFGWLNTSSSPRRLEFDLWPPPRPNVHARLVTVGATTALPEKSVAGGYGPTTWGWAFDRNPQQCQGDACRPSMECREVPAALPNHLHCVYTEPPFVAQPPQDGGTDTTAVYKNARMTPSFVTTRFDVRMFLGWH